VGGGKLAGRSDGSIFFGILDERIPAETAATGKAYNFGLLHTLR
jgi:hypothetical protein